MITDPQDCTVRVVIYEDLGFEGDPTAGRILLRARQKRVQELGRVLELIEGRERFDASREAQAASLRQKAQQLRRMSKAKEDKQQHHPEAAAHLSATRLELAERLEATARDIEVATMPEIEMQRLSASLNAEYKLGRDQTRSLRAESLGKGEDR